MNLSQLKPPPGQKHKQQRVGQGMGSGRGKYSGRGAKGAKSISGYSRMRGFEGGQMPLHRRLPKRGFTSPMRDAVAEVRLSDLQAMTAEVVDLAALKAAGVVPRLAVAAKVIASGELTRKLALKGLGASKGARAAIEAAGGTVEPPRKRETPARLPKKTKS